MQGLLGRKLGMTQVYEDDGRRVDVTVIELGPCVVTQLKTPERDGYSAAQVGFVERTARRTSKPLAGHFKKAETEPKRFLREFRLMPDAAVKSGDTLTVALFAEVPFVDVTAISKGRGFAGVVKRHHMRGGRMTHGGHSKRRVGSIGQCSYPARVVKNQRMPGHMGCARVTMQNLRVVKTDADKNLLLVRGGVPGPNGGLIEVRRALKKTAKAS